jgi:diguanylate cyclase (GGDEF)-like protein
MKGFASVANIAIDGHYPYNKKSLGRRGPIFGGRVNKGNRAGTPALRQYLIRIQKKRALVYNLATIVGIIAKLLGVIRISWTTVGLFMAVINGTALLFGLLAARGPVGTRGRAIHVMWMIADVAIITWMIDLTGNSQSSWFPWYLAPVAAAGYIFGRRAVVWVMLACFGSYIGLVLITEPNGTAVARALTNLLMLFGSALIAIMGISTLQEKRRTIAQLKELETKRAADLETLAAALGERSRELDVANERLQRAAITDVLTGLHNRRYLEEKIQEDVALALRTHYDRRAKKSLDSRNSDLGFLLIDIDRFKEVNDTFGHQAGDRALVVVAKQLQRTVRESDSVIRWGGEEFLILARQMNGSNLHELAERLRRAVHAQPIAVEPGVEIRLTCSVGFSQFPLGEPDLFSWNEVVQLADAALLLAKQSGRDLAVGIELGDREFERGAQQQEPRDLLAAVRAGYLRLITDKPLVVADSGP